MRRPGLFAFALAIGIAAPVRAEAQPADEQPRAEDPKLASEVAELRRRLDEHLAAPAVSAPPSPLRFSGYAQLDWVAFRQSSQEEIDPSTGDPLNQDRFLLRRGHLRADYEKGILSGALEIDANTVNGAQVRPIDAEASIGWPPRGERRDVSAMGTVGLMKIPFGFEVPELDNVRPFLERASVLRALFPGEFDLGARFKGSWRAITWAVAVMNGHPIGERQLPGRDPTKSKDLLFRLGVDTKVAPGWRLETGISGVTGEGFHAGTPATKDVLVWRDVDQDGIVQQTEIQVIPGSAATPSQTFHRFAVGADARVHADVPRLGELVVRGEIVWGSNLDRALVVADPIASGRDLRERGFYVGATQELGPYAMIGLRYDRYDPDLDARRQVPTRIVPVDAAFTTVAMMAMARYEGGRLVVEYDHNTNALGRTASGAPTTLADDALTLRAQVSF